MHKAILIFSLFLVGITLTSLAQGSAAGCLLPNNTVYSNDFMGSASYYEYNSPFTPLSNNYCSWTPSSTGVSCSVCTNYINLGIFGYLPVGCTTGIKGNFTMVECPLDDDIIILIGFSLLIFPFLIKRE